jgi:hypothetical protein
LLEELTVVLLARDGKCEEGNALFRSSSGLTLVKIRKELHLTH